MSAVPFDKSTDAAPWPFPPAELVERAAEKESRRFAAEPVTPSAFGVLPDAEDRHFEFLQQRAEQIAARVGGDTLAAKNIEIGQLRSELRDARHTLARLEGRAFAPQAGCEFCTVNVGEAEVMVEYELIDGSEVSILQVLLNGVWVDPEDYFSRVTISCWEEEIGGGL